MMEPLQAQIEASETACEALMAKLIAGNERLLADMQAFRGEFREGFQSLRGVLDAEFAVAGTRLESIESALEVLRRLPEPDQPA